MSPLIERRRSTHSTRGSMDVLFDYALIMDVCDYPSLSRAKNQIAKLAGVMRM